MLDRHDDVGEGGADALAARRVRAGVDRDVCEPTASEQLATMPSNRVGTFNLSAERNRFGTNFGNSVVPQRPAPLLPVMPRLPAIPTH